VFRKYLRRRPARVATIVLCAMAVTTPASALARALLHATLLRSTPAANSHVAKFPDAIRLVFSEQIVPELSQITLVLANGDSARLKVANDPHNVHVLVGTDLGAGRPNGLSKVVWRVLSADGHPVGGNFSFTVGSASATAPAATPVVTPAAATPGVPPAATPSVVPTTVSRSAGDSSTSPAAEDKPVPLFASLFRGVGLGAFMAGIGLLFFGVTAGERRSLIPGAAVTSLITIGTLLLVAHAIAWLEHVSPTMKLSGSFLSSVLSTTVGRVELVRVALAVLTLWGIALARHRKIALVLGIACVLVSGAVGHPAAIHPLLAIPTKAIHLVSASLWIGGLLWLVWVVRCDSKACEIEARRVSSLALYAVIAILLSGLLQTVLFLNTPSDLFRYGYGNLVLAKILALMMLIGFGIYNRYNVMPSVESTDMQRKLSKSVKLELAIITLVVMISGFLAYVPTPPSPQSALPTVTEVSP
jgi:copper transport protein